MVVATAFQVGGQVRVGEGVCIHALQFTVLGQRRGLVLFVPITKLLAPELARENLFGAREALRDFGFRSWKHLAVAEAVHVGHLEPVDEHPVRAREVVRTPLEGGWMHVLPIAGQRAREMHGVLHPRAWSWWMKIKLGRRGWLGHENAPGLSPVAILGR